MVKKWRDKPRRMMINRTLGKKDMPSLIEAMWEDGVVAIITSGGIVWYHAEYRVTKLVVGEVWGLSSSQMDRVNDYIYGNDPFVNLYKHDFQKVD